MQPILTLFMKLVTVAAGIGMFMMAITAACLGQTIIAITGFIMGGIMSYFSYLDVKQYLRK